MSADAKQTVSDLERNHDFVISVDVLREGVDRLVGEMQPTYRQRGFRKGKVPADVIRRQNLEGLKAQALQDVVSERIREWAGDAGQERMLGRPRVEFVGDGTLEEALKAGQDLAMRLRAEYLPEIPDITQLKISVARPRVQVTDADADREASALRDQHFPGTPVEDGAPVQNKDILLVSASPAEADAKADASGQHVPLTLGDADLGADADAALAGRKVGDSVEAVGTLPGAGSQGQRNEPARLKLEILAALRPPPPDLSDEVARHCEFADLNEMMEWARRAAEDRAKQLERVLLQGRLHAALSEHLSFAVPPTVLDGTEAFLKYATSAAPPAEDASWKPDAARIARIWVVRRAFLQERGIQIMPDDLIRAARQSATPAPITEEERSAMREAIEEEAPAIGVWHASASRKRFFEELAQALELSESDSLGLDEARELAQGSWSCREIMCIPG